MISTVLRSLSVEDPGFSPERSVDVTGPRSVEDYLSQVPEEARAALEKLRNTIKAAAPNTTETISY